MEYAIEQLKEYNQKTVERLKNEGQLTRNTGTNSIKSLREDLMKSSEKVVQRLRAEGQLTRNTGTNSIKSLKEALMASSKKNTEKEIKAEKASSGASGELLDYFKGRELKEEENRREFLNAIKGMKGKPESKPSKSRKSSKGGGISFDGFRENLKFAALAAGTAFIGGFFSGLNKGFDEALKATTPKFLKRINTRVSMFFGKITTGIGGFFRGIGNLVSNSVRGLGQSRLFRVIGTTLQLVREVSGLIFRLLGGQQLTSLFKIFGSVFGALSQTTTNLIQFMQSTKLGMLVTKTVGGFTSVIGKIVGKFILPLTTAFETITGFIEGYQEGGLLEGLQRGVRDGLNVLIGWAFDLPLRAAEWIYKKLGWEEAAKSLEGVSFNSVFDAITDFFKDLVNEIVDKIKSFSFSDFFDGEAKEGVKVRGARRGVQRTEIETVESQRNRVGVQLAPRRNTRRNIQREVLAQPQMESKEKSMRNQVVDQSVQTINNNTTNAPSVTYNNLNLPNKTQMNLQPSM